MRILVDEMPTAKSPCLFWDKQHNMCRLDMEMCDVPTCPYLEPLDKPAEDDCK